MKFIYILGSKFLNNSFFLLIISLLLFSCENDEIEDYIQRDAKIEDLIGTWAIQTVESNGKTAKVPINYSECGTDYFTYYANGIYEETVFKSSDCRAFKNSLSWKLVNGVINLSSNAQETEDIEIRKLNKNIFIFQANLDLDQNPGNESYIFTAIKYEPPLENDIYTDSFRQKSNNELIEFVWDKFEGYNKFIKYEILRTDNDCNVSSAKLIKTITDVNETFFVDLEAFSINHCYKLKIFTDEGLLGESDLKTIYTNNLRPQHVIFNNANANNETVTLEWQKSTDPYFSHYEIKYYDTLDFSPNYSQQVKIIEDINTISFVDTNPPYLLKPVYVIIVHNKFGNYSFLKKNENSIAVNLNRKGMLDIDYLSKMIYDKEDQSFIFYYRESTYGAYKFAKYSSLEKKIIAESYKQPNSSTSARMQIVTSIDYGKEFIYPQHDKLWVYNADDLTYKYSLSLNNATTSSFKYLGNSIWVLTDYDNVFTYKRENSSLILLDKKPHFSEHQGSGNYEILKIDINTILVSHDNEGRAILFKIDENGKIVDHGIKNIPLQYGFHKNSVQYNTNTSYILNTINNRIYTANDYSLFKEFSYPLITSSLSSDGKKVYGTNNLSSQTDDYNTAKRELLMYDINSGSIEIIQSKGYPLYVVDDNNGKIICLSANFPGETFNNFQSRVKNLFIETIQK